MFCYPYALRKASVEVVKSQFFLFRQTLNSFCHGLGIPTESKLYDSLYSRMDSCEVMIVRDVRTGRVACVTNVHLYWNPRFPDVKVLQVASWLPLFPLLFRRFSTLAALCFSRDYIRSSASKLR